MQYAVSHGACQPSQEDVRAYAGYRHLRHVGMPGAYTHGGILVEKCIADDHLLHSPVYSHDMVLPVIHPVCSGCCQEVLPIVYQLNQRVSSCAFPLKLSHIPRVVVVVLWCGVLCAHYHIHDCRDLFLICNCCISARITGTVVIFSQGQKDCCVLFQSGISVVCSENKLIVVCAYVVIKSGRVSYSAKFFTVKYIIIYSTILLDS